MAMAGLGPVTCGYSLLSTLSHTKSMADVELELREQQLAAVAQTREKLIRLYGSPCLLTEHGRVPVCAEEEHQYDGHCFHAHFLLFPGAFDISDLARNYFSEVSCFSSMNDALAHATQVREYVLVSPREDVFTVFSKPLNLPRQLARFLVAHSIGTPGLADWRQTPNWEQALSTANALASAVG